MSIEQLDTVDIVSTDSETGDVVLTISDHLEWSESGEHLLLLQAKLNTYLAFVESGEILEHCPDAGQRSVVFSIVFKFKPDALGEEFLSRATQIVQSAGFAFRYEVLPGAGFDEGRLGREDLSRPRGRVAR